MLLLFESKPQNEVLVLCQSGTANIPNSMLRKIGLLLSCENSWHCLKREWVKLFVVLKTKVTITFDVLDFRRTGCSVILFRVLSFWFLMGFWARHSSTVPNPTPLRPLFSPQWRLEVFDLPEPKSGNPKVPRSLSLFSVPKSGVPYCRSYITPGPFLTVIRFSLLFLQTDSQSDLKPTPFICFVFGGRTLKFGVRPGVNPMSNLNIFEEYYGSYLVR